MSDGMPGGMDSLNNPGKPNYRALLLLKSGTVIDVVRIPADSDIQAIKHARALVDGHAVELWDGLRFIESFQPID